MRVFHTSNTCPFASRWGILLIKIPSLMQKERRERERREERVVAHLSNISRYTFIILAKNKIAYFSKDITMCVLSRLGLFVQSSHSLSLSLHFIIWFFGHECSIVPRSSKSWSQYCHSCIGGVEHQLTSTQPTRPLAVSLMKQFWLGQQPEN